MKVSVVVLMGTLATASVAKSVLKFVATVYSFMNQPVLFEGFQRSVQGDAIRLA